MARHYQPRGRLNFLLDAMQGDPDRVVWPAAEAARVMKVGSREVGAYTQYAVKAGVLFRSKRDGDVQFSLRPFPEEAKAAKKSRERKEAQTGTAWNPATDHRIPRVDPAWRPPVMVAPRTGSAR